MSYKSSVNRLLGQTGYVLERVPADRRGTGVVKIKGQLWTCESDWVDALEPGTPVIVTDRIGPILLVLPESG